MDCLNFLLAMSVENNITFYYLEIKNKKEFYDKRNEGFYDLMAQNICVYVTWHGGQRVKAYLGLFFGIFSCWLGGVLIAAWHNRPRPDSGQNTNNQSACVSSLLPTYAFMYEPWEPNCELTVVAACCSPVSLFLVVILLLLFLSMHICPTLLSYTLL